MSGDLAILKADFIARVADFSKADADAATSKATQQLYEMRWGPTKIPIYNVLGLLCIINPHMRAQYITVARWLSQDVKVPVDGTDASGTTALSNSISTHPAFDPELAQILYDAGGQVGLRNRYGATAGHEICMVLSLDAKDIRRATEALGWFVAHGGNVDVKDGDGITVRLLAENLARRFPSKGGKEVLGVIEKEYSRREMKKNLCCIFCGRDDGAKLLSCGRCKQAKYCEPSARQCQKLDWPRHKAGCKPIKV